MNSQVSHMLETHGTFGEVTLSYDEMYQSLYSVGQPCTFAKLVVICCGYSSPKECPQEDYWQMANELALDLAKCPENVHPDDFCPCAIAMSSDTKTQFIYLVNYKGEGAGYFEYEEVKNQIAGEFVAKFTYRKGTYNDCM